MKIIHLDEIDSTNNYAKSLADDLLPDDFMVVNAIKQTAGRGQGDHVWESAVGLNITFSCVFKPHHIKIFNISKISQAVSLGITDFLISTLQPDLRNAVKIKWPNDIYVADKKITGILIENIFRGEYVESSVIGVGLNVNQIAFADWLPNPTSLKLLTGNDFDTYDVLKSVSTSIQTRLLSINDNTTHEYIQRLYKLNEKANLTISGQKMCRTIIGVDEFGEILFKD